MGHDRLHKSEHENGGVDAIDPANIGTNGVVEKTAGGDVEAHSTQHENGGTDEMSIAGLSGEAADPQPAKAHNLGGSEHSADTLANLNLKVSDATLDDSSDPRDPNAHASSHENGGSDEVSVAGLSGELADPQPAKAHNLGGSEHSQDTLANLNLKISDATLDDADDPRDPNAHASSHENGGGDEMSVAGLSGVLADAQTPAAHKNNHKSGGSDAFANTDLLEAVIKRIQTSTGPTDLTVGGIADGEYLVRSGSSIIGGAGGSSVYGSQRTYVEADELITAFSSYAGGADTQVTTAGEHQLEQRNLVLINNTTNYNGTVAVKSVIDSTNFVIDNAFVADDARGRFGKSSGSIVSSNGMMFLGLRSVTGSLPSGTYKIESDIIAYDPSSSDPILAMTELDPTEFAITAFADGGGGTVTVTATGHTFVNGNNIVITGTTNYNGSYEISSVATNTFKITKTWVSNDATGIAVKPQSGKAVFRSGAENRNPGDWRNFGGIREFSLSGIHKFYTWFGQSNGRTVVAFQRNQCLIRTT